MTSPAEQLKLYNRLHEVLGPPEADTLMELLPAGVAATQASVDALRSATEVSVDSLRTEMNQLRTEMNQKFGRLFIAVIASNSVVVASIVGAAVGLVVFG